LRAAGAWRHRRTAAAASQCPHGLDHRAGLTWRNADCRRGAQRRAAVAKSDAVAASVANPHSLKET
jgi:hypothetical protein